MNSASSFRSLARLTRLAPLAVLSSALLLLAAPHAALANCSRPIVVPASSLGKMVVVDEATGEVSGIYPELLRRKGSAVGCSFEFRIASRARADLMFQNGEADLLVAAPQIAERQQWSRYVPMVRVEWLLVSTGSGPLPQTSAELAAMPGIRFNAVNGYNYGRGYSELLRQLREQGKLELVANPEIIAKKMLAGRADFTFMPSNTFAGALDRLHVDPSRREQFQYSRLKDVPASTSGVYVSRQLNAADTQILVGVLNEIRAEGSILERATAAYSKREMSSLSALPAKEPGLALKPSHAAAASRAPK